MNGVPIARILGFEVRLHLSWLFIIAIITVTVAGGWRTFQPDVDAPIAGASASPDRSGSC